jgi:hypothetical protein
MTPVAFTHLELLWFVFQGRQRSFFILGDFSQQLSGEFFNTALFVGDMPIGEKNRKIFIALFCI